MNLFRATSALLIAASVSFAGASTQAPPAAPAVDSHDSIASAPMTGEISAEDGYWTAWAQAAAH